jgi:hypothetical protein
MVCPNAGRSRDVLWTYNPPEMYELVIHCGWNQRRFSVPG